MTNLEKQLSKNIVEVRNVIIENLKDDIYKFKFYELVALWNRFSKNEREGIRYIYSLFEKSELIELLQMKNFNVSILGKLWENYQCLPEIDTEFFTYEDDNTDYVSLSTADIHQLILGSLKEIVNCALLQPYIIEYSCIYKYYINSKLIQN